MPPPRPFPKTIRGFMHHRPGRPAARVWVNPGTSERFMSPSWVVGRVRGKERGEGRVRGEDREEGRVGGKEME